MENPKIYFEQGTALRVPQELTKQMYLLLALTHFPQLRFEDYNELTLFRRLVLDFKRHFYHSQKQFEENPDNLHIYRNMLFFDRHYKALKKIIETLEQ